MQREPPEFSPFDERSLQRLADMMEPRLFAKLGSPAKSAKLEVLKWLVAMALSAVGAYYAIHERVSNQDRDLAAVRATVDDNKAESDRRFSDFRGDLLEMRQDIKTLLQRVR